MAELGGAYLSESDCRLLAPRIHHLVALAQHQGSPHLAEWNDMAAKVTRAARDAVDRRGAVILTGQTLDDDWDAKTLDTKNVVALTGCSQSTAQRLGRKVGEWRDGKWWVSRLDVEAM